MKYLVIGSKGQLGKEFVKHLSKSGLEFIAVDIDELDISDRNSVIHFFKYAKPDIVLNCSAYNLVDKAEENPGDAFKVNAAGVKNLALASEDTGSFLVHYSSDYVFDGIRTSGLYIESDNPKPINKYGESKLLGEQLLSQSCSNYLILRLSWVFGEGTQNFINKILEWAKSSKTLKIASDETSVPTSTTTIVEITLSALQRGLTDLYHLTNSGYTSRYEWAKFISEHLDLKLDLIPVSKEIFNLPAKRPDFSAMDNGEISRELNITIPTWQESVSNFINSKKSFK